jgi:hypothetical protein
VAIAGGNSEIGAVRGLQERLNDLVALGDAEGASGQKVALDVDHDQGRLALLL